VIKRSSPAQPDVVARWKVQSEFKDLHTDLLSARCIVDRLKLQARSGPIAEFAEPSDLKKLAANLLSIVEFVKSIEEELESSDAPRRPRSETNPKEH